MPMNTTDPPPALLTVDDYRALPPVRADHRIAYGPDPAQLGDLYLPQTPRPHPVVLLVHGGCWRAPFGLEPLGPLCAAFTQAGLAVWNLEYRRLGDGGGWPATFLDVARGAAHLQTLAPRFGLDLTRVVAMGHSAGGHLALWLAGRHHLPAESGLTYAGDLPLRGVVALAGIPDLVAVVAWNLCGGACHELVGGLPEEMPDRYRQASPHALLPLGVPQVHLVGRHDTIVPPAYLEAYTALAAQHDAVHLEILPDAGHFEPVVPTSGAWPAVLRAVQGLMERE